MSANAVLLAAAYEAIVTDVVERVAALLRERDLYDQTRSPLGPREHQAAVKRRRKEKAGGAYVHRRAHLLTREALLEELERSSDQRDTEKPGVRKAVPRSPELVALDAELAAIRSKKINGGGKR